MLKNREEARIQVVCEQVGVWSVYAVPVSAGSEAQRQCRVDAVQVNTDSEDCDDKVDDRSQQ